MNVKNSKKHFTSCYSYNRIRALVTAWRGDRVVECNGLENRRGFIALRGFESHPLRHFISR